jgi:hypothetical protein
MTLQAFALRVMGQDVRPRPPHCGAWSFDLRRRFRGRDVASVPWWVAGLSSAPLTLHTEVSSGG